MGLLDDAIREHLDLKRRRGADPAEIERAEREALGPVRRNREPSADEADPFAEGDLAATGTAYDEPDDGVAADLVDEHDPLTRRRVPEDDPFEGEPFEDDPFAEEPAADSPAGARAGSAVEGPADLAPPLDLEPATAEEPAAVYEEDLEEHPSDRDADDEPKTRVMRVADAPGLSDATSEYDVEDALAGHDAPDDPEDADEDVLEETPEFLQDTPDHDRLWFEQRPPRDFDFDG